MLEKTETVMSVNTKTKLILHGTVAFDCSMPDDDPDEEVRSHQFFMETEVWADMGGPETITLTVEKGDTLNG